MYNKMNKLLVNKVKILKSCMLLLFLSFSLHADISIQNAWEDVLHKHNGLKASSSDIQYAKLKQESAEGMYLPSVSLTGSYTHLNEPIGFDTSGLSNFLGALPVPISFPSEIDLLDDDITLVDLQVLYPLYMGGKIDAAQDAYAAKSAEAKAHHRIAEDKAFLELVKLYYGVIVTKSLYRTRVESQKSLQIHYGFSQKLYKEGQIAKAELLHAKVKLNAAKIESMKAKHKSEIVQSAFYKMVQRHSKPNSSLFIARNMRVQNYYVEKSIDGYAMIEVLDAKAKQTSALVNIEESAWQPKVLGFANVNLYKGDSPLEELAPSWMIGVGVKFDLFSRKDRAKEVEAAKVLQSKVASLKMQAQEDLSVAVQKTYDEMFLYQEEFTSLNAAMALAKENYKLRSLAFKEGLSTSVEVVEAQIFLSASQTQRLNAAYNYVKKLSELCVLSGDRTLFFSFEKSSKRIK